MSSMEVIRYPGAIVPTAAPVAPSGREGCAPTSPTLPLPTPTAPVEEKGAREQKVQAVVKDLTFTRETIEVALVAEAVNSMVAIIHDTNRRTSNPTATELSGGIFYANEYYKLLLGLTQGSDPAVCRAAKSRFDAMIRIGSFFHGFVPKDFFSIEKALPGDEASPTGYLVGCRYILKDGKKPSEAIAALKRGVSFLDCGAVCNLAYYEALLKVLGPEKFDVLFAANSKTPLSISDADVKNPLKNLVRTIPIKSLKDIRVGQQVTIPGCMRYPWKHTNGEESNFNTLCSADKPARKFIGHGLDPAGMSHEQVVDELLEGYNQDPIGNAIVSKAVGEKIQATYGDDWKTIESMKGHKMTREEFVDDGAGQLKPYVVGFNFDRIFILWQRSLSEAKRQMDEWQSQYER